MKRTRASLTLEASLLFPFLVFLTLYAMYWGEWKYNNCAAEAIALRATSYAVNLLESGKEEITSDVYQYAKTALEEKLLGQTDTAVSVHLRGKTVKVTIEGNMKSPLPELPLQTGQRRYEQIYATEEGKWVDAATWVRIIRVAKEVRR